METTNKRAKDNAGSLTDLILFAIVILTAVLIVFSVISDATINIFTTTNSYARATQAARCGIDKETYTLLSPMAQYSLEDQCDRPPDVQP